jgi:hypothetical protein
MSAEYNNPLDNSDVPIRDNSKSAVGGLFESVEQAQQYKLYLENLKLIAEIKKSTDKLKITVGKKDDGTPLEREVLLSDLIPKESEFERVRRVVIANLNKMSDDEIRVWMARFGTDNVFELSGRITSYQLDKKKRDEAFNKFNVWKS